MNLSILDDVTAPDVAFGTTKHLPPMDEIPEEFKNMNCDNKWIKLFATWFYKGLPETVKFSLKPGVDGNKLMSFLKAHMASWEPKHEHKTAGVAYLMSQFIDDYDLGK